MEPKYFSSQVKRAVRFFLPRRTDAGKGLAVVSGGCEWCAEDYDVDRGRFRYFGVEFVHQGAVAVTMRDQSSRVPVGGFYLYGPGVPHRLSAVRGQPLTKYFVVFGGADARQVIKRSGLELGVPMLTANPDRVRTMYEDMIRIGRGDRSERDRFCQVALEYLLLTLAEEARPFTSSARGAHATYRGCRQYIQDHFAEVMSVAEVAEACGVDPAYLCRLFRRFGGESPYKFLLHLKMSRAVEWLQHTAKPVNEIAEDLRFTDAFVFSRAFKRLYGIAPAHARSPEAWGDT